MAEFTVQGMSCGHCIQAVTNAVHSVDPFAKVDVDLETKLVSVDTSGAHIAPIKTAIEEAGYEVDHQTA